MAAETQTPRTLPKLCEGRTAAPGWEGRLAGRAGCSLSYPPAHPPHRMRVCSMENTTSWPCSTHKGNAMHIKPR